MDIETEEGFDLRNGQSEDFNDLLEEPGDNLGSALSGGKALWTGTVSIGQYKHAQIELSPILVTIGSIAETTPSRTDSKHLESESEESDSESDPEFPRLRMTSRRSVPRRSISISPLNCRLT